MFSILQSQSISYGVLDKIMPWRNNDPVELSKVSVTGGSSFNVITAFSKKGKIDWDKVYEKAGRTSKYLILADGVVLPEDDSRFAEYEPKRLFEKMLYNSAIELLIKSTRNPQSISAILVDEDGLFASRIDRLVKRASKITVVTKKHELYSGVAERLMEEYGITILIKPNVVSLKGVDILISPSFNAPENLKNTIVTNNQFKRVTPILKPKDFSLPHPYSKYLLDGVDEQVFAAALYEFCGAKSLGKMTFKSFMLNSYEISLLSAAKTLDTN